MKIVVSLVLFLFIFKIFLSTPTIVSVIEKGCNVSNFYKMSEEGPSNKETKADYFHHNYNIINYSDNLTSMISSSNLSKHDNFTSTIFIPPPKLI